jgi:uncharacterized protein with PIN domain
MATKRWYLCRKCNERSWAGKLFPALNKLVEGRSEPCPHCHETMQLVVSLAYKLGE